MKVPQQRDIQNAPGARPTRPTRRASRAVALGVAVVLAVAVHAAVLMVARPVVVLRGGDNGVAGSSNNSGVAAGEKESPRRTTVSAVALPEDVRVRADIADTEPLYLLTPLNYGYDFGAAPPAP
jgi:hypothetical protein